MKQLPEMQTIIDSGEFLGFNKPHGRVTVEPGFFLNVTGNTIGTSTRGPYRWFQRSDNSQVELEIPNVKSIDWDRNIDQEAASCTITIYNHWLGTQESPDSLGSPGYFWPEHGYPTDAPETTAWGHNPNAWLGLLDNNALIRTYQGYGGYNEDGSKKSIQDCLNEGSLTLTGVWITDTPVGGSNGMITLTCRDMMKLVIDQQVFPPIVPTIANGALEDLYPLEYWPANSSAYDNPFEPIPDSVLLDYLSGNESAHVGAYSITAHPTGNGYWVMLLDGHVYNYGPDTAHYGDPFTEYGSGLRGGYGDNKTVAIMATSTGEGYWVLDKVGQVYAYGDAVHHGDGLSFTGKVIDFAKTNTDGGYWIIQRDGVVQAFGDASTFSLTDNTQWVTKTDLMQAYEDLGWVTPVDNNTAMACIGHPTEMALLVVNGNGETQAFGDSFFGMESNTGGVFRREGLKPHESTHAIEVTDTGEGYWIAFGSGRVVSFGDAQSHGNASLSPSADQLYNDGNIPGAFFLKLVVDIAKSADHRGFYCVRVDGNVEAIDCQFWGDVNRIAFPGTEGNYGDDIVNIVKELLLWAGFLLHSDSYDSGEPAPLYAAIESTGLPGQPQTEFSPESLDKKPIIDVINTIKNIVGYYLWIDDEGLLHFESGNNWQQGNFLLDGTHTTDYVTVTEKDAMIDYTVSSDGSSLRSEIIVGTYEPDPENPEGTVIARYTPPTAPKLKGISIPGMIVNEYLVDQKEVDLMAELIGLQIWFAMRQGSLTCVANPNIMVNDQIKIVERNTSEVGTHYVRGISSKHDLDTGNWTYTITTHRLTTSTGAWVITADDPDGEQTQHTSQVTDWLAGTGDFGTRTRTQNRPTGIPGGTGE